MMLYRQQRFDIKTIILILLPVRSSSSFINVSNLFVVFFNFEMFEQ